MAKNALNQILIPYGYAVSDEINVNAGKQPNPYQSDQMEDIFLLSNPTYETSGTYAKHEFISILSNDKFTRFYNGNSVYLELLLHCEYIKKIPYVAERKIDLHPYSKKAFIKVIKPLGYDLCPGIILERKNHKNRDYFDLFKRSEKSFERVSYSSSDYPFLSICEADLKPRMLNHLVSSGVIKPKTKLKTPKKRINSFG